MEWPKFALWIVGGEINVFPFPHSAITAAARASFQRFTPRMMARVWAGKTFRNGCPSNVEGASSTAWSGEKERRILSPSPVAQARNHSLRSFGSCTVEGPLVGRRFFQEKRGLILTTVDFCSLLVVIECIV